MKAPCMSSQQSTSYFHSPRFDMAAHGKQAQPHFLRLRNLIAANIVLHPVPPEQLKTSLLRRKSASRFPLEPCSPYNSLLFWAHAKIEKRSSFRGATKRGSAEATRRRCFDYYFLASTQSDFIETEQRRDGRLFTETP